MAIEVNLKRQNSLEIYKHGDKKLAAGNMVAAGNFLADYMSMIQNVSGRNIIGQPGGFFQLLITSYRKWTKY